MNLKFQAKTLKKVIVEEKGMVQISDESVLEEIINKIIAENQESVIAYRSGKDKLFGFFVGQAMKQTEGKANPALINKILKKNLEA